MRTSLSQQIQSSLIGMNSASNGLLDAQNRATTGKRILRPSDDVPGTDRALSLRSTISTTDQLTDNTTVCMPILNATESAINNVLTLVSSVRGIAMSAANDSYDQEDRDAFASQLNDILAQFEDAANAQFGEAYLFSGTAIDSPAVTAQAGTPPYAYTGDSGVRKVQILSWSTVQMNISGQELFNFDGSAGTGSTDLFTMVTQLRDTIQNGTVEEISAELDNIDANRDNVLSCQARVGSWMQRVESAQTALASSKLQLKDLLSAEEDIDLGEAIVDLKTRENIYQAAMMVSTQVMDLSLASINYMN